jgi:hypothetical protein
MDIHRVGDGGTPEALAEAHLAVHLRLHEVRWRSAP